MYIETLIKIKKIKSFFTKKKNSKKELAHLPWGIVIDTTTLCNNSCSFCWRKNYPEYLKEINEKYGKNPTMDFGTYKKIIDDVVQYESVKWLSLCGPMGEPCLNENLADFFEYAYKKNHFNIIAINTNGLAINRHDIGKLLNNITEFSISVDSIRPETYEKIHGSRKFLPHVIDNIKSLIEYKQKYGCVADIVVRFTENEINQGEYPEFEEFFLNLGVNRINHTKVHAFAGVKKELINKNTAKDCCQMNGVINFNFMGDMTTCCINWHLKPSFGSIKNKTIAQMWNNRKMKHWIKNSVNTEPCKNCSGLGPHVQKID